ncbi:MAG: hypothetical protein ABR596_08340, partial [Halarsenatibacteraceae bacterium]
HISCGNAPAVLRLFSGNPPGMLRECSGFFPAFLRDYDRIATAHLELISAKPIRIQQQIFQYLPPGTRVQP